MQPIFLKKDNLIHSTAGATEEKTPKETQKSSKSVSASKKQKSSAKKRIQLQDDSSDEELVREALSKDGNSCSDNDEENVETKLQRKSR